MRIIYLSILIIFSIGLVSGTTLSFSAGGELVPGWIKNTAGWWANDEIDDQSYLNSIEYLVKEKIIHIQPSYAAPYLIKYSTYILEEELPELRSGYTESLTMSCKEGDFVLSGGWIAYDTSSNFTLVPLSSGPVTDDSWFFHLKTTEGVAYAKAMIVCLDL